MSRKSNTVCSVCGKNFYKRPSQKSVTENHFCDRDCYRKARMLSQKECAFCKQLFQPNSSKQITCSRSCASKVSRGSWSTLGKNAPRSKSEENLWKLQCAFDDFDSCMIEGCNYNVLYEIHRIVEGQNGGEYVIGNMFAICPNHHAEIHRKLTVVEKIDNKTLKVVGSPSGMAAAC